MGQVKRDGDSGDPVRGKPIIREPEIGAKTQSPVLQLLVEMLNSFLQIRLLDLELQITHPHVKELFIGPICPFRLRDWPRRNYRGLGFLFFHIPQSPNSVALGETTKNNH
jgi:hypothetical protein